VLASAGSLARTLGVTINIAALVKFNPFSGARRIAALSALLATVGTLVALLLNEPYVTAAYAVSHPNGPFVKTEDSCPDAGDRHYFSAQTSSGKSVSIQLCLMTMEFGDNKQRLIPYRVDDKGMVWGAASFSSEVATYRQQLERRFALPARDEIELEQEVSRRFKADLLSGLGYLAIGLFVFAAIVWAIGWVVRGFMGIPLGRDHRPQPDLEK
jgi:hypothetical protein